MLGADGSKAARDETRADPCHAPPTLPPVSESRPLSALGKTRQSAVRPAHRGAGLAWVRLPRREQAHLAGHRFGVRKPLLLQPRHVPAGAGSFVLGKSSGSGLKSGPVDQQCDPLHPSPRSLPPAAHSPVPRGPPLASPRASPLEQAQHAGGLPRAQAAELGHAGDCSLLSSLQLLAVQDRHVVLGGEGEGAGA